MLLLWEYVQGVGFIVSVEIFNMVYALLLAWEYLQSLRKFTVSLIYLKGQGYNGLLHFYKRAA